MSLSRKLRALYRTSPADVVQRLVPGPRARPVSAEFLRSIEYAELMARHLPFDGSYDLHEAQNQTASYRFRQHEIAHRLGVFRWRGMLHNRDLILDRITAPGARVVDFGGAAGPLGFGSLIVDQLRRDTYGQRVPHARLSEVEGPLDVIFSSHCLEHVPQLDDVLQQMIDRLARGGLLLLHVPAFSCERWRATVHDSRRYNAHVWTFGLTGTEVPAGLQQYECFDEVVGRHGTVCSAEYCGDDSIFLVAER